jgi:NADH:ubiquinone oxidoreductase subunit 2 (subunit N)
MPELDKVLSQLAEKLGTTVPYLWSVLLRQARIEIVRYCIFILFVAVATVYYCRWVRWFVNNESAREDDGPWMAIMTGSAIEIILLVISITMIVDLPTLIFNPAYWALREILGAK